MDDQGRSYVARQPSTDAEQAAMWRASIACPTKSLGTSPRRRAADSVFPYELTPGVLALGHNARSSFAAHSYLVVREAGNVLIDSPRFARQLVPAVEEAGGIDHVLLSHRDDVADAERWAEHFSARVWIHEADKDAAPYATDIFDGDAEVENGLLAIHTPGHTAGHMVFHIDDRWLFTGDTLMWNHRRNELDVTADQTWDSWDRLADSMDRLSTLNVEWVFPGHGKWHHVGADLYRTQMAELGQKMRSSGQAPWAERPDAAFNWL